MAKTSKKPKKKTNALASAATRRLMQIAAPKMTAEQVAHMMLHAEQDGQAERVELEGGEWAWRMQMPDGSTQMLRPTPDMLEALARFDRDGHPAH